MIPNLFLMQGGYKNFVCTILTASTIDHNNQNTSSGIKDMNIYIKKSYTVKFISINLLYTSDVFTSAVIPRDFPHVQGHLI